MDYRAGSIISRDRESLILIKRLEDKKTNLIPVCSREDAKNLLKNVTLTRRTILAKVAEFYDPCGFWEPITLQMKLAMLPLKGLEWDERIPDSEQIKWTEIRTVFVELNDIQMPRCCIPTDGEPKSKIRLIYLSDAAEFAGGAVVYAGRKLKTGGWSCSILASKSKLMDATIPRNELSAILLCTKLAFLVKQALGDLVDKIMYCTDSTIALSWCKNITIKLRLFLYDRVMTILRMCEWTTGKAEVPLFHIDGKLNLAAF